MFYWCKSIRVVVFVITTKKGINNMYIKMLWKNDLTIFMLGMLLM
jgi:hypothetical protein